MWFGDMVVYVIEWLGVVQMSKEEVLKVFDWVEEVGLVYMSCNIIEDIDFICNCDCWYCDVIKGVLKQFWLVFFFNFGFQLWFDLDLCTVCEICIECCLLEVLVMGDNEVLEVNLDCCFGCVVCVIGCLLDVIIMEVKVGFLVLFRDLGELISLLKVSFVKQD